MSANCRKSCNLCGGTPCNDARSECPQWAGSGFCSGRYEAFMSANCKRSCRLC